MRRYPLHSLTGVSSKERLLPFAREHCRILDALRREDRQASIEPLLAHVLGAPCLNSLRWLIWGAGARLRLLRSVSGSDEK